MFSILLRLMGWLMYMFLVGFGRCVVLSSCWFDLMVVIGFRCLNVLCMKWWVLVLCVRLWLLLLLLYMNIVLNIIDGMLMSVVFGMMLLIGVSVGVMIVGIVCVVCSVLCICLINIGFMLGVVISVILCEWMLGFVWLIRFSVGECCGMVGVVVVCGVGSLSCLVICVVSFVLKCVMILLIICL